VLTCALYLKRREFFFGVLAFFFSLYSLCAATTTKREKEDGLPISTSSCFASHIDGTTDFFFILQMCLSSFSAAVECFR
jgi:hypothetical protein